MQKNTEPHQQLAMQMLYTKYKTASSEEEQEKARQEYLDKRGVTASYRW